MSAAIRVGLPSSLALLARSPAEVLVICPQPVTQAAVLDALEAEYPMLRGTIRDAVTRRRRPFIRFFACLRDLSHDAPDDALPMAVVAGEEPFMVIGAIAGG
jgi:hypothetical protein